MLITDIDLVLNSFRKIPVFIILLSLLFAFLNYVLRFLKWHYYINTLKINLDLFESFMIFLSGLVMSVTPGKFGEVLKSIILKQKHDEPISKTSPIIITERITDMISLLIIAGLGLFIYRYGILIFIFTSLFMIFLIILFTNKKIFNIISNRLNRFTFFQKHLSALQNINESFWILLKTRNTILMSILSLFAWFSECVAFYLITSQFNNEITFILSAFIYSMATIIGSIMFLPGGLGGTESSMIFMLINFGLVNYEAVVITTSIRIVTLWFAVLTGWISFHYYEHQYGKIDFDS